MQWKLLMECRKDVCDSFDMFISAVCPNQFKANFCLLFVHELVVTSGANVRQKNMKS